MNKKLYLVLFIFLIMVMPIKASEINPTTEPTVEPTVEPTTEPTIISTPEPTLTITPSPEPTVTATPTPSKKPTPTPSKKPTPTPSKKPTPTPTKKPTPTPKPANKGKTTYFDPKANQIKKGMVGENVYQLKWFLKYKGYKIKKLNYQYDNELNQAIKKYQKENKLKIDGNAGKETLKKVNKDIKRGKISLPVINIKLASSMNIKKKWIVINKTSNTLYVFKGRKLLESYPVATGKKIQYTPEGKFKIIVKFVNPSWGGNGTGKFIAGGAPNNPLGKRWLGINIGGGGRYGIHGNAAKSSIGTYASAGCVRMHNDAVEGLFNKIPINTPVWIGQEKKINSYGIKFTFK